MQSRAKTKAATKTRNHKTIKITTKSQKHQIIIRLRRSPKKQKQKQNPPQRHQDTKLILPPAAVTKKAKAKNKNNKHLPNNGGSRLHIYSYTHRLHWRTSGSQGYLIITA
jgi:predicted membrane metal-binding protein